MASSAFLQSLRWSVALSSLCLLLAAGCATSSLPDVAALTRAAGQGTPEVVGTKGKLPPGRARALLGREVEGARSADLIKKTTRLMESLSGHPLTSGNKITLLVDGPATYKAMFEAMTSARNSINFETFIFSDDEIGRKFADLFVQKQAEGVEVNLIYDSVGSLHTAPDFFQRLRASGVNVLEFNPVNPLKLKKRLRVTQRDHRKVLVVDGRVGIAGGVNVSGVYSRPSSPISSGSSSGEGWRDTDVLVEGPAVAELQHAFLETWQHQKGPPLADRDYFPRLEAKGRSLVEVIPSFPGEIHRLTYVMYVAALQNALYSIDLTTPYFVPDRQIMKAITDAVQRGVEVRIIVPGSSDETLAFYAGRSHYEDLLESGVKIYERRDRMVHAKTAVIDGVWSTVGSTNLDLWSFARNNEINVMVIGTTFANELEGLFERDLAVSDGITKESWSRRSAGSRVKETFSRLLSHWL